VRHSQRKRGATDRPTYGAWRQSSTLLSGGPEASAQACLLRPDITEVGRAGHLGSGQRKLKRSWETWAPYQGRIRPSMQREESPAMPTGLERIAAKARCEPKLPVYLVSSSPHEGTGLGKPLSDPTDSSPWIGQTVPEAKESFREWDRGHAAICSSPGISSAKYPARVYPEARQARENARWACLA